MTEQIDLTDDGNEASTYVAKDEGSRKRVVALAEGLNERLRVAEAGPVRKRVRTAVDGVELPAPAANGEMLQGRSASVATVAAKPALPPPAAPLSAPSAPQEATRPTANTLLAQLHEERLSRMNEASKAAMRSPCKPEVAKPASTIQPSQRCARVPGPSTSQQGASVQPTTSNSARSVSILSYNLWFNEDVELAQRMRAVGDIIEREGYPDLLLFQEVTQNMVLIFRQSNWFRRYHCSPVAEDKSYFTLLLARRDTVTLPALQPWMEKDFANSCMGRSILYTRASVGGRPLVVGTSHLESPVGPGPQQMVTQRWEQLEEAVRELEGAAGAWGDVLLAGDLNWSDTRDGPIRMPPRWCDAWSVLEPRRAGCTWDPVSNPMLTSRYKGSRLDRVLCRLSASGTSGAGPASSSAPGGRGGGGGSGWQLDNIKLVGTQALPGLSHEYKGKRLPVLPSDHFGLLVKLIPAEAAPASTAVGRVLGSASAAPSEAPSTSAAPPRAQSAATGSSEASGSGRRGGGAAAAGAAASGAATEGGDRGPSQEQAAAKPKLRRLPKPAGQDTATAAPAEAAAKRGSGRSMDRGGGRTAARRQQPEAADLTVEDDDDDDDVVIVS
ncbi:hypothetical protein PLESTB_000163000 [Pleodorina starrii]|uniref:Endonuclease/exonuclease/phosphatase domain-containing protein n=1 Tax=Pleodorina starrii TaxID=330485 RepID=A0A9W6BBA4_9CHLO|nr:hypothetical protein PLESTM_000461300 [Pleodorina starrii]GLC48919.1 hypothetical protein PLESTB_000163000 [Pleodorina starrii]GLC72648.1 hypothetical protein PLESTF_001274400 [Pleodorina starrii]